MSKTKVSKMGRRGKTVLAVLIAVMFVSVATAALLPHYGKITTTVNANQTVWVDGQQYPDSGDITDLITEEYPGGETFCFPHLLDNRGSIPIDIELNPGCSGTDFDDPPNQINCNGITTTYWKVDTAPTIDGVIGAGEWDEAQSWTDNNGVGGTATIYAMVDTQYLYVAFDTNDEEDARLGENIHGNDQTSVNINPSDAPWGMPCDIIFQTGSDPDAWGGTSSGVSDGWETDWEIDGTQLLSLPGDLVTKTLFDPCRVTEWQIPLSSIGISLGGEIKIGGAISLPPSAANVIYPIGLDWNNVNTYASFTVGTEIPKDTPFTLQSGELLNFYICHSFDKKIYPGIYTITTTIT